MFEQSSKPDVRKNTPGILREAAEQRISVTAGIIEWYQRHIFENGRLPLGAQEMKEAVRAYIEKVSVDAPQTVIALGKLLQLEQLRNAKEN